MQKKSEEILRNNYNLFLFFVLFSHIITIFNMVNTNTKTNPTSELSITSSSLNVEIDIPFKQDAV